MKVNINAKLGEIIRGRAMAQELYALTRNATAEDLAAELERLLIAQEDGCDFVAERIRNELDDNYRPGSDSVADAACDAISIAADHKESVENALTWLGKTMQRHCPPTYIVPSRLGDLVDEVVEELDETHASLEQSLKREREAASAEGRVTKEDHEASERSVGILRSGLVGALNALDAATQALESKPLSAKRRERAVLNARAAIAQGQERLRRGSPGDKEVPPQKV